MINRLLCVATGVCVLALAAMAQEKAPRKEFDVVDVRQNVDGGDQNARVLTGGSFTVRNMPLGQLVLFAYNIRQDYLNNAPSWFDSDHFDMVGKATGANGDDDLREMLQSFLADKFKLKVHTEDRPKDVYALVVGKSGLKIQKSADQNGKVNCQRNVKPETIEAELTCTNVTMKDLTTVLQQAANGYFDRMVVDQTNLVGQYDIKMSWVGRQKVEEGGLTAFDALEKSLGLKAESKKIPMKVIFVDHAEKLVPE